MSDVVGLLIAYGMIAAVIGVAGLLLRTGVFTPSLSRKFIHISVSHWWLLAMHFHTGWLWAAVGPVTFIVFNYIAYRTHLLSAMEDPEHRKNLGTVWFPVSLLLMVLLTFAGPVPLYVGGIGILTMGYGDGLASIVGRRWGAGNRWGGRRWGGRRWSSRHSEGHHPVGGKSIAGSLTMFFATAVVVALFMLHFHPLGTAAGVAYPAAGRLAAASLTIAAIATVVELATPRGLDNLTVPLLTALSFYALFA